MATDATWIDEASAVLEKLLQAHGRELAVRQLAEDLRNSKSSPAAEQALVAASAVTRAAIVELLMTFDDRIQDHTVRLVQRTGLSLQEPTVS